MIVGRFERIAFVAINKGGTARNLKLSSLKGREFFIGAFCSAGSLPAARVIKLDLTFHLVAQSYFDSLDPQIDYVPEPFAVDGFIHCTDGADEMARTANRYYQSNIEPHHYLYIDKARVRAPIRYDAEPRIYPHIYGALNRDAIVAVRPARREPNGTFLPPEALA